MADLVVTPANVAPGANAVINKDYLAGETITAGQAVYRKSSDAKWYKAQMDGTAEESGSVALGVAVNGASAGQPLAVQTGGQITIGATVVATTMYIVSAAAGSICPIADIASTNLLSLLGYATTTAILELNPRATQVAKA